MTGIEERTRDATEEWTETELNRPDPRDRGGAGGGKELGRVIFLENPKLGNESV